MVDTETDVSDELRVWSVERLMKRIWQMPETRW